MAAPSFARHDSAMALAVLIAAAIAAATLLAPALAERPASGASPDASTVLVDGGDTTPDTEGCGSPANPCNTVQRGVDVAEDGDTVSVARGVYPENLTISKHVVIRGGGPQATIVDGQGAGRVVLAFNDARLGLEDLTIRNGWALDGAGVNANFSTLALTNVVVSANVASLEGGGILVGFGSSAVLSRVLVSGNQAPSTVGRGGGILVAIDAGLTAVETAIVANVSTQGAGIASQGTITLTRSAVRDNIAGANGGGVLAAGRATLVDCTIESNESGGDGAGVHASSRLIWLRGSATGNEATGAGGGLALASGAYATMDDVAVAGNLAASGGGASVAVGSRLEAQRSTLVGNEAAASGGGLTNQGTTQLVNSTLSGNRAQTTGGGARCTDGTLTLRNVTLKGNRAGTDAGGVERSGGQLSLASTIVAENIDLAAPARPDCLGSVQSLGHNLVGDGSGCVGLDSAKNDLVGTGADPIDPLLGPLADNGGQTDTHALLDGSPAIDAGSNCPSEDQRAANRPVDGDGDGTATCDIGAFEYGASSATRTPTPTASATLTPTKTITPTQTSTPSVTPTASATISGTLTPTPTRTRFPTVGPSPTGTLGPSPTPSATETPGVSPTATDTATAGPSPTPTTTPMPSDTPTEGPSPEPTSTELPTTEPPPTLEPTETPDPTPPTPSRLYLPWTSRGPRP